MGKFTSTQYTDKISNLTDNFKKILNNPYYIWQTQKGLDCTYYSIDKRKSTLDEAAKIIEDNVGINCPIWYNKIIGFILYGINRIQLNVDLTDFGPDSSDGVSGEAIVLPNTIEPCPGDYFMINHVNGSFLFSVTDVQPDTLEDGSNLFAIQYKLEYNTNEIIEKWNISDTFRFLVNNVGTNLSSIVSEENYNYIACLEDAADKLREFYKVLFMSDSVQTLIFSYNGNLFYDPFMLEFVRSNKLLIGGDNSFVYLQHMIDPGKLFPIIYHKTVFEALIEKDKEKMLNAITSSPATYIESTTSIFSTRYEDYFRMTYDTNKNIFPELKQNICMFESEFIQNIYDNKLYDSDILYNIIIKYMNGEKIYKEDIKTLDTIDYDENIKLFYTIPCVLYCLEQEIRNHMS